MAASSKRGEYLEGGRKYEVGRTDANHTRRKKK